MSDQAHELAGLRTVVTGSSSGIGRAIALEFGRAGAHVVVHAHHTVEKAEETAAELRAFGVETTVLQADLRKPAAIALLVDEAFATLGGVDVWVNNAGADVLTGEQSKLSYDEKLQLLFEVDVRSTILLTRAVGERLSTQGGGAIINIGWDQAERGMEGDSGELFGATKAAVMAFTKSAALSLAPKVRVNCIAPGWIQTAWGRDTSTKWHDRVLRETPLGRWGQPEDVAHLARFLASPAAVYITGQVLRVNGGAVR